MKIYIVGSVASGKSTLARRISKITGVPCRHLDEVVYTPDPIQPWGNRKRPEKERDALFFDILGKGHYIMEDVGRKCFIEGIKQADTVVLLEIPLFVRRVRIMLRWIKQNLGIEKCMYRPRYDVLRSMFRWAKNYDSGADGVKARVAPFQNKTVVLHNNKEVKAFLTLLLQREYGTDEGGKACPQIPSCRNMVYRYVRQGFGDGPRPQRIPVNLEGSEVSVSFEILKKCDIPLLREIIEDDNMAFCPEQIGIFLSQKQNIALVAKLDGKIIGMIYGYALTRMDGRAPQFFMYSVGIHSAYQNKGYGTELVQYAVNWARENGYSESFVPTEKDNVRACRVYEKAGMTHSENDCDRGYVIEYHRKRTE